ncbi:hypothetical protein EDS67_27215 [candidate division KSB1 bacterium]|nr:MAG: hypothetical protein EDS67_27215 [candidate division KSB1 bacterium]MBC6949721.1 hypothetical protein [candidate division KSB1 bacterium]MCE7944519.1 hypothetical protein [Chlorobi bacterium CHB1]MDL1876336.1 hypothetical protein [Cytophagia bacterium CHB2]
MWRRSRERWAAKKSLDELMMSTLKFFWRLKMFKQQISISPLLILVSAVLIFSCVKKEKIEIGAVLPLTGSAAVWGQNAKMGLDIALKEINESGGILGSMMSLAYEDSESDPTKAVSALQKLININKIQVVVGDIASSSVLAMAPVAEGQQVVLLSPGASNPDITNAGNFIFRNWQSDALEGQVDADFAYSTRGYRKMAVLYVNNAYGGGLRTVFEEFFKKLGGQIVASEGFEQSSTDLRSQISRIAAAKPDAVFMPGYPPEMGAALKQAKEMGLKFQILSVQAFDDPQILQIAGDAAEGVIFSVPKPPDTSDTVVSNFMRKYKQTYNKEPGVCSDTGYDALRIIAWAMNSGARSSQEIKDQLLKLKDFSGAAGSTTFDENGDVLKPFIFKKVENGKFVSL